RIVVRVLRSPWLGPLVIAITGLVGFVLSPGHASAPTLDRVTVSIRATRDSGAGWDFGGGQPDPRITVAQGTTLLATCEAKDQRQATCEVGARIERDKGAVRVSVVDVDTTDHDTVGDLVIDLGQVTTPGGGALERVDVVMRDTDNGAWARMRPLWIALAIGVVVALVLLVYRRRDA
ncbi:MAG TPA: hypothetical protein VK427_22315, partial [Kofleriaceae bacterium]|nr:hypothetical protein [Kofleriaceae bacterium]